MNNNFDNGMNPVGGVSPTPVPNNVNPMTDNVLPTNPGYVDNGMLNNNVSEVPNVTPVVANTIAGVENNVTVDNKKEPNKLVTLFLVVLAVAVGILAMNTDSLFFDNTKLDLVDEENFEQGIKEYVARKDKKTELYTFYEVDKNKIVVYKKKSDEIHAVRPEDLENYKLSKDLKIYTYNSMTRYDENDVPIKEEWTSKIDLDLFMKYMTSGGYPAGYIERKGKTVVQIVVFAPDNLHELYK